MSVRLLWDSILTCDWIKTAIVCMHFRLQVHAMVKQSRLLTTLKILARFKPRKIYGKVFTEEFTD